MRLVYDSLFIHCCDGRHIIGGQDAHSHYCCSQSELLQSNVFIHFPHCSVSAYRHLVTDQHRPRQVNQTISNRHSYCAAHDPQKMRDEEARANDRDRKRKSRLNQVKTSEGLEALRAQNRRNVAKHRAKKRLKTKVEELYSSVNELKSRLSPEDILVAEVRAAEAVFRVYRDMLEEKQNMSCDWGADATNAQLASDAPLLAHGIPALAYTPPLSAPIAVPVTSNGGIGGPPFQFARPVVSFVPKMPRAEGGVAKSESEFDVAGALINMKKEASKIIQPAVGASVPIIVDTNKAISPASAQGEGEDTAVALINMKKNTAKKSQPTKKQKNTEGISATSNMPRQEATKTPQPALAPQALVADAFVVMGKDTPQYTANVMQQPKRADLHKFGPLPLKNIDTTIQTSQALHGFLVPEEVTSTGS